MGPMSRRLFVPFVAFLGLITSSSFTMPALAGSPGGSDLSGCERTLADASASVAAMQARMRGLNGVDKSERCQAMRLYFFEVVKARAVTALCKSGSERERNLSRFDSDVDRTNGAIADSCL